LPPNQSPVVLAEIFFSFYRGEVQTFRPGLLAIGLI